VTPPDPWHFALLAAAAWRTTRLGYLDDLTIEPRRWVTGVGDAQHHEIAAFVDEVTEAGGDPWSESDPPLPIGPRRFYLSRMIHCPHCLGAWVSLAWFAAWLVWPRFVVLAAVPWAIMAVVSIVATRQDG
jgi:hypothetical protein